MSSNSNAIKNFAVLTGGRLTSDLLQFVFFITLSRTYGAELLGLYGFAMATAGFSWCIANFGMVELSIKEIKRAGTEFRPYAGAVICLRIFFSLLSFLIIVVATLILPLDEKLKMLILILSAFQIFESLVTGITAIAVAHGAPYILSFIEISQRFFGAVIGSTVILLGAPIEWAVSILPVTASVHAFIAYLVIQKVYGPIPVKVNTVRLKQILSSAKHHVVVTVIKRVANRADILLLLPLAGATFAGIYNAAFRIMFMLILILNRIPSAMLPTAVELRTVDQNKFNDFYCNSIRLAFLLGVPLAGGIYLISEDLIMLLFGLEYKESFHVLHILAMLAITHTLLEILSTFVLACDEDSFWSRSWIIVGSLNVIFNVALIPIWSAEGAALAAVLTEIILIIILFYKLRRYLKISNVGPALFSSLIGTVSFLGIITLVDGLPLIISALPSAFDYDSFSRESLYTLMQVISEIKTDNKVGLPLILAIPSAMIIYCFFILMIPNIRRHEGITLLGYGKKLIFR